MLWIAFRLYLWGIGDTGKGKGLYSLTVVNCFQIVSLRYWWHLVEKSLTIFNSCELLSDCIFEVLVTPGPNWRDCWPRLWIAFRLYLWGIGDTKMEQIINENFVVNCFQIVSLRYWWHHFGSPFFKCLGCELLSDCIFEVLVTPKRIYKDAPAGLWIAFRLYLWGIGDTNKIQNNTKN